MKRRIGARQRTRLPNGRVTRGAKTRALLNVPIRLNGAAAKWSWHYRALITLHDRLLLERGERVRDAAQPLEGHSMDNADSATDAFDHDLALSQLSAQQDVIYEVEDAINRILSGAYGICEATGKPIPAPRLKAIPWTRFARDVELRLEEDRAVSKPGLGALGSVQRGLANDAAEGESEPEAEDESLRKIFKPEAKREPSINKRRKGRML